MTDFQQFLRNDVAEILSRHGFSFDRKQQLGTQFGPDRINRLAFSARRESGMTWWGFGLSIEFPRVSWLVNGGVFEALSGGSLGANVGWFHPRRGYSEWAFSTEGSVRRLRKELREHALPLFKRYSSLKRLLADIERDRNVFPITRPKRASIIAAIRYLHSDFDGAIAALEKLLKADPPLDKDERFDADWMIKFFRSRPTVPDWHLPQ